MEFTTRRIERRDQEFVSDMQYEALFVPPGAAPFLRSILAEPDVAPYHVAFASRPGDVGVLAESPDGFPLGAAWVRLVPGGYGFVDAETPELGIAVVADARGEGWVGTSSPRCSAVCSVAA